MGKPLAARFGCFAAMAVLALLVRAADADNVLIISGKYSGCQGSIEKTTAKRIKVRITPPCSAMTDFGKLVILKPSAAQDVLDDDVKDLPVGSTVIIEVGKYIGCFGIVQEVKGNSVSLKRRGQGRCSNEEVTWYPLTDVVLTDAAPPPAAVPAAAATGRAPATSQSAASASSSSSGPCDSHDGCVSGSSVVIISGKYTDCTASVVSRTRTGRITCTALDCSKKAGVSAPGPKAKRSFKPNAVATAVTVQPAATAAATTEAEQSPASDDHGQDPLVSIDEEDDDDVDDPSPAAAGAAGAGQGKPAGKQQHDQQQSLSFDISSFNSIQSKHKTAAFYDDDVPSRLGNKFKPANLPPGASPRVIVRRGATFKVGLTGGLVPLSSSSPPPPPSIKFTLPLPKGEEAHDASGHCKVVGQEVECVTPSAAPIGIYKLELLMAGGAASSSSSSSVLDVIVLFNPYTKGTTESVPSSQDRAEFLESTKGLIFQGFSDDHTAHVWHFDQFSSTNLATALRQLDGLTASERTSPFRVSRHLTWSIGERVCYGRWGSGSYTTGQPPNRDGYRCTSKRQLKDHPGSPGRCSDPGRWTGSSVLLAQHTALVAAKLAAEGGGGKPVSPRPGSQHEGPASTKVQYCQCFVFAGVYTTLGRALGLATRPVTTFQSAHDTNGDRAISKFYLPSSQTKKGEGMLPVERPACPAWCPQNRPTGTPEAGEPAGAAAAKGCTDPVGCSEKLHSGQGWEQCKACSPCLPCWSGGDSVWSFHVWNEVYFKGSLPRGINRHRRDAKLADGWQAVDSTPQEYSGGRYQMGPASVGLVKQRKNGCFDQQFVLSEVNADLKLFTRVLPEPGTAGRDHGWQHYSDFHTDPWDDYNNIGFKTVTKGHGPISAACLVEDEEERDCTADELDLTLRYKYQEPSGAGRAMPPAKCPKLELHAAAAADDDAAQAHFLEVQTGDEDDETPAEAACARGECPSAGGQEVCDECPRCSFKGGVCRPLTAASLNHKKESAATDDVTFTSDWFTTSASSNGNGEAQAASGGATTRSQHRRRVVALGSTVDFKVNVIHQVAKAAVSHAVSRTVSMSWRAIPVGYDGKAVVQLDENGQGGLNFQGCPTCIAPPVERTVTVPAGSGKGTSKSQSISFRTHISRNALDKLGINRGTTSAVSFVFSATVKETGQTFMFERSKRLVEV